MPIFRPAENVQMRLSAGFSRFWTGHISAFHSGEGNGWDVSGPQHVEHHYLSGAHFPDRCRSASVALWPMGIGIDRVDGIFHTHAHDDHFAGLPALMRAGRRIRYFATPLVRASVEKKLAALLGMEGQFNNFFDVQDLVFDKWNDVEGLEVMPIYSPHPVETNIYVFRTLCGDGSHPTPI